MVTTKHCSYGHCKNDSRLPDRPTMRNRYGQSVFFVRFPGKKRCVEKCKRWVDACIVRDGHMYKKISYETLTYDNYICSLHFVGENGPTDSYPDPVPARMSTEKRNELENNFRRKKAYFLTNCASEELASLENVKLDTPPVLDEQSKTTSYVEMEIAEVLIKLSERNGMFDNNKV